jgi:ABC-type transport system involved in Fe-S cluster assembly fused permease/ATPase subunit
MQTLKDVLLYTRYALYLALVLYFVGIRTQETKQAADQLENIYKLLVGITLVVFANPFADLPKDFLKALAFSAGLFIVASSGPTVAKLYSIVN